MNRITLNCQKYIKPPFYNNYTCQFYKLKLNFQYPNKQIRLNFQLKTWQFNFLQLQTDHSPNEFSQRQQNKNYIKMQLILEKQLMDIGKDKELQQNRHYKYMRASLRRIKRKEQIRNSERKQYYYGNYVNELPQGEGINWSKSQNYIGQMYQGKKHGIGLYQGLHQDCYMGQWDNGKRCGSCLHINGFINVGKVTIDLKYGVGQEYLENGDFYIGEFRNGKPNGRGEYIWSNGNCYQGQFESGLRNGYGTWQSKTQSGKNCYKGYYANDKQCCEGIFEYSNGTVYVGNFIEDKRFRYGNWKQNQLQTFEKARISLNEFPQQHQIQKILENQETYSEIADEPDLDQIEDQFQMKFKNPMQKALFKIYLTIPVTMICISNRKLIFGIFSSKKGFIQFDLLNLFDESLQYQSLESSKRQHKSNFAIQAESKKQLLLKLSMKKQHPTQFNINHSFQEQRNRKSTHFQHDVSQRSPQINGNDIFHQTENASSGNREMQIDPFKMEGREINHFYYQQKNKIYGLSR